MAWLAVLMLAAPANAENPPEAAVDTADIPKELNEAAEKYRQQRRHLIEQSLPLTAAEAEKFWPMYERLQHDFLPLFAKRRAIISEFGENYDDMSDAVAKKLMLDRLELSEARYRLLRAYLPKFERVLPPKKLARYIQIEGMIAASVEAGIAEEIPLIK